MTAHYRENADTAFEAQFLTAMIPLIVPGILPIGWMESKKWDEMSEGLVFTELLPASFDPATAYTMRFLQSIYPDTEVQSQ